MKIVDVKGYLLPRAENPLRFQWRQGIPGSDPFVEMGVLRIVTDEGVDGFAETSRGPMAMDIIRRRFKEMLKGEDPLLKERLWHKVWEMDRIEQLPVYLFGLVDVALWDIASKVAGIPLYQLLGGYRSHLPAYASTVTFRTIEEYLDVADQCLALGFRAIKLHAFGEVGRDGALAVALRRHVGDEIALMYDGSAAFDWQDAIRLGRILGDQGFEWYEEPMREFSISSYQALRTQIDIPLLVAETSDGSHYNTADFIHFGAGDIVRTEWRYKGGLTGGLRIAHLADAFQLRAEVHGGGMTNLHLACAIPNTTYYESLIWGNPVERESLVDCHGIAHVSHDLGAGFAIDLAALERQAVAVV